MTAQIIILALFFIGACLSANSHGKPKTGKESFWVWLISSLITLGLLYWGGFFDCLFK